MAVISMVRGDTYAFNVALVDDTGADFVPDVDSVLIFTARRGYHSDVPAIVKTLDADDFIGNVATFNIAAADTRDMLDAEYVFDVEYRSGDYVKTVVTDSKLILANEVTRYDQ